MAVASRKKLTLAIAFVLLVNLADLFSTYLASPDLEHEWNLLHRQFGLGWMGLIGAKLIGGFCAVLGYAYYLNHRSSCYPDPGQDFHTFSRYFTFGRKLTWIQSMVAAPANRHFAVNVGYFWMGMQILVLWVAIDNILLTRGIVAPMRHYSEWGYHFIQSILVAAVVLGRFYAANFRRYCDFSNRYQTAQPLQAAMDT